MAERFKVGDEVQKGSGDPNILQLKDQTKIRLLDDSGAGGIAWRQHTIKHAKDSDQVEFAVCPGPRVCPLCRKPTSTVISEGGKKETRQNFPVSKRFATNVWDYGSGSVKVLIAGPQVFSEFGAAKVVSIDPTSCDWIVHKMGKSIQTKYKMVRDNAAPFAFQDQVGPDALIDLEKYGAATAPEKIFELLDKAGVDYEAIETQTFTPEEAIEFVLPYGRCKGLTVEQALAQDQEWCEWLHGQLLGEERFAEPVFLALQTAMEARGLVGPVDETPMEVPTETATETPVAELPTPTEPEMVTLIAPDGDEQTVPKDAEQALLGAGYTLPPEPEPTEVAPEFPVMMRGGAGETVPAPTQEAMEALEGAGFVREDQASEVVVFPVMMQKDGSEVSAPTVEAMEALEASGFMRVGAGVSAGEPEPAEEPTPTGPREFPEGEAVHVTIAGSTMPMAFKAAFATLKAGTPVEFQDPEAAEYANLLISTGGEPPREVAAPAQSSAEDAMHKEAQDPQAEVADDPDKPFKCQVEGCGWAGRTQGSLTQHINKQHGGEPAPVSTEQPGQATPPPATTPQATMAGEGGARERVKTLLAQQPQKDYRKLLDLFEEVTGGKRDISKFTEEELVKLEQRLIAGAG